MKKYFVVSDSFIKILDLQLNSQFRIFVVNFVCRLHYTSIYNESISPQGLG